MDKYFKSQQDDEEVIVVIRRHWFQLLPHIAMAFLIYLIGFTVIILIPVVFPTFVHGQGYNIFIIVLSLIFLYNTAYLFSAWVIHYLNVGIITTEHVVEICQDGLFSRRISELGLDRIQDVSASQKGMTATMFNFGVINIQTAGELPNFIFQNVPTPNETAQEIMELEEDYSNRHGIRNPIGGNANVTNHNPSGEQSQSTEEQQPNIEYPNGQSYPKN